MTDRAGEVLADAIRLTRWHAANRGLTRDVDNALSGMEHALQAQADRPGPVALAELRRAAAQLVDVTSAAEAVPRSGVTGFDRTRARALAYLTLAGQRVSSWNPADAADSRGTDAVTAMGLARTTAVDAGPDGVDARCGAAP